MSSVLKQSSKPTRLKSNKWRGLFLFGLLFLILVSLIAISRVEHQIRVLESQYYQSLKQALKANEEWGRLRLEKEHLSAPARVEYIAKTQLGMTLNKSNRQTIYLRPRFQEEVTPILEQSDE